MKLNKKQKRTATIASMAALLAVVLGMGGSTFAKYIETQTVTPNTAVVAKWGYVIQATKTGGNFEGQTIFEAAYNEDAIKSTTEAAVVAPGASGSFGVYVTGQAEVASELTFTFTITNEVHLDDYYPIDWKVTYSKSGDVNSTTTTLEKLSDVKTLIEGLDGKYAAEAKVETLVSVEWSWAFEQGKDAEDTILGNYAVNGIPDGVQADTKLGFSLEAEVVQTEDAPN